MLKIFGLLVLVGSLFVVLVGLGGAVMNFAFPPNDLVCQYADEDFKKAEEAMARYQAAKGTPVESAAEADAQRALKAAQASGDSCGRMKANYRFYGMIFSGVAFVGVIGVLFGGLLTFLGFRKKKIA